MMKFKLARPIFRREIEEIIYRVVRKYKKNILRVGENNLKEIAEVCRLIEKSGLPEYLVCKKLPRDLGRGVFLHPDAKPILRGEVIAPYSGEITFSPQNQENESSYKFGLIDDILLTKEEQAVVDAALLYRPKRLYSLNLDAAKKGNFARFINHSEAPNVVADLVTIPENRYGLAAAPIEVLYRAKKTIHPGEQLLVSYEDGEKSYWGALKIKPVPITPKTFQLNAALEIFNS